MTHHGDEEQHDIYDLGLQADLAMWHRSPIERRRILKLGALGIGTLLAASGGGAACVATIPQETAGPYPADGSQASSTTLNALALAGIVRQDIRTSLGTGNTAPGVPMSIELTLINSAGDCAPLVGYAVYLWHCNRDGEYSLYSSDIVSENYLRGVQQADVNGKVTFTSIFPACYSGRWPHVHFEVYPSLDKATAASNAIHTSQLAMPKATCDVVYATTGYEQSVRNLAQITLDSDNVFGDGYSLQVDTVTGDVTRGYTAALTVGIDPAGTNSGGGTSPGSDGSPTGAPPPGAPPSGAPQPSGGPRPSASASPVTSAAPSPSAVPGLPNTGAGGGPNGPDGRAIAAPLAAVAALLIPLARRFRRR